MTLRVLIQICLFSLLAMMTTSCASSKKYGNRNSSYTKSRTARSNQNKPAKSNDDYLAVVDVKNDKNGFIPKFLDKIPNDIPSGMYPMAMLLPVKKPSL